MRNWVGGGYYEHLQLDVLAILVGLYKLLQGMYLVLDTSYV